MSKGPWVPVEHVLPLLEIGELEYGSKERFAEAIGFGSRRLYSIYNEQAHVSFDAVDRIVTALGLMHIWHIPKAQGGLSDCIIETVSAHRHGGKCNACGCHFLERTPKCVTCNQRTSARKKRERVARAKEAKKEQIVVIESKKGKPRGKPFASKLAA